VSTLGWRTLNDFKVALKWVHWRSRGLYSAFRSSVCRDGRGPWLRR